MIAWEKLGCIVQPSADFSWLAGGAGAACVAGVRDGCAEILISGRDSNNRSRIGKLTYDLAGRHIVQIEPDPLIELGEKGTFDHNGTSYPWLVPYNGQQYLYYTGWTMGYHVSFINDLGLAIKSDGQDKFKKISRASILNRTDEEPFGIGSVCVLQENDKWEMWYTCFQRWGNDTADEKHYYHIKYAYSGDGIHWERPGLVCIDFDTQQGEYVTGKPCVLKYKNKYVMWYSYRGKRYKIGFAVSEDGKQWVRKDHLSGIDISPEGWDSEMICYSFVFIYADYLYMLYNGNGFGKAGVGLARMPLKDFDLLLAE